MKKKKITKAIITIIGSIIIIPFLIPVITTLVPDIYNIIKNENYSQIESYLQSFGVWGGFLAVIIQMLQVFSVVVPAPVIWISVGVVYGTFWGVVICTTGIVLGHFVVFTLARKFKIRSNDDSIKKKMKFLWDIKNQDLLILLMFLTPGFPNGIVPYVSASTKISTKRFLLLAALGSIPSILLTGGIGDLFISGNKTEALIITLILACFIIGFMIFKDRIIKAIQKFEENQNRQKKEKSKKQ